ncbi:hypothetical protein EOJ36_08625 [Sandaracinomonas limnophila]|uniref:Uncharacterized protein n=1 Tax=Sandaracinomonas limnophila TaxID=1862386 RepID=A0A437PS62_9BACT|nr:hypothetical protein [Sandaracinomonas limnophila]RVU25059.1 hypothetical protein EOJ36_08625 [Sandaracinomonas limnophila]
MKHQNCNCEECVWNRIVLNSEKITIHTKRGLALKYKANKNTVEWIPMVHTLNVPYNQNKSEIFKCFEARKDNNSPSNYPGTAQSYKWALLNNKEIWV